MKYYFNCFKKYAVFTGRASRSEYWFFILFNLIATMIVDLCDLGFSNNHFYSVMYLLFSLIPGLAVLVRRLHDVGKNGGYIFLFLIPIVGWIALLILLIQRSELGVNRYGLNPKRLFGL